MQNKKVIILIVLSIGAVISLIYGITSPTKSKRHPSRGTEPVQAAETILPADRIIPAKRLAKKTGYMSWGRNPFAPKEVEIEEILKFKLNGIMWDETNPKAIINDEIVGIGDKIGVNRVVDIKEDKVILNDGISNFELILGL